MRLKEDHDKRHREAQLTGKQDLDRLKLIFKISQGGDVEGRS